MKPVAVAPPAQPRPLPFNVRQPAPVMSVQPAKSLGRTTAYALRRIGQEWPMHGWTSDQGQLGSPPQGCEIVKITVEPT